VLLSIIRSYKANLQVLSSYTVSLWFWYFSGFSVMEVDIKFIWRSFTNEHQPKKVKVRGTGQVHAGTGAEQRWRRVVVVGRRSRNWTIVRRRWHHTPPRAIQSSGPKCATTASMCSTAFCTVSTRHGRRLSPTIPSWYSCRSFFCSAMINWSADHRLALICDDVEHKYRAH